MRVVAALFSCVLGNAFAVSRVETQAAAGLAANPIRKVVSMLQSMQTKIAAEGAKKEKMFDKYMCYCSNAEDTLGKSISDAETKIPLLESSLGEDGALKKQLESELKEAKSSRAEAKKTIEESTALREKEASAFAKVKADAEANLGALSKAIPAIEQGMKGAFLQTKSASVLRELSVSADMVPADRDLLASFLESGDNYVPASGQIVGILKTMQDEMEKDFAEATAAENKAIADFASLMDSKKKEIVALTKAIESKTARVSGLGVKLAEMENDLEDTKEQLAEDKKFLADLDKNCALKKDEWAAYKKMEAMELVALADTIKVLNDDDALELFKKTLPGASSFVQVTSTSRATRQRALSALRSVRSFGQHADPRLDLIEMAMHGGKIGFEKIIKMIDDLVVELKKDQSVDDDKKSYCLAEFDKAEDKKKVLDLDISDLSKVIADAEEAIATLASEIKALEEGIKKLDKAVADATATRKEEHDDYVETLAANSAAKDLLAFAKNRLQKFYNPKLYKAPPKRELSEEDRIVVNMGGTLAPTAAPGGIAGTGIGFAQTGVAPPPPPEANLAYKKSGSESGGVMAMIDLLVADLDKDIQTSEVEEKDAQKDYEAFMSDSSEKRALDSKAITDKSAAKAATETQLEADEDTKKSKMFEAMETAKYIGGLHEECDWLLKYYDARKAARTGEIEAMGKAKAHPARAPPCGGCGVRRKFVKAKKRRRQFGKAYKSDPTGDGPGWDVIGSSDSDDDDHVDPWALFDRLSLDEVPDALRALGHTGNTAGAVALASAWFHGDTRITWKEFEDWFHGCRSVLKTCFQAWYKHNVAEHFIIYDESDVADDCAAQYEAEWNAGVCLPALTQKDKDAIVNGLKPERRKKGHKTHELRPHGL